MRAVPTCQQAKFNKPYVLKNTIIPDGFILVQDTSEQKPLFSRIPSGLTIMAKSLLNGDYSIRGFEDKFAIERKATDIYPYCTGEYDETTAKMIRFKKYEFAGLAIEMRESETYQFHQYSKAHPEKVRAGIISFQVRYGVHVYFGTRETCARWILDTAVKFWNIKHEV